MVHRDTQRLGLGVGRHVRPARLEQVGDAAIGHAGLRRPQGLGGQMDRRELQRGRVAEHLQRRVVFGPG